MALLACPSLRVLSCAEHRLGILVFLVVVQQQRKKPEDMKRIEDTRQR